MLVHLTFISVAMAAQRVIAGDYISALILNAGNGSYCSYDNYTFKSDVQPNGTCKLLTCNWGKKTVTELRCKEVSSGCTRVHNKTEFPHCCEQTCYSTSACKLPNGHLLEHKKYFNYTEPCVEYYCNNGNLTVHEKCSNTSDSQCSDSAPFGMNQEPYPTCCGGTVCAGRRRKRASKNKRNRTKRHA
uniref:8.9 kDa family member n=1 Tax=Rhipicephalus appendiculatus TaxID=34631 RepID=A0A131YRH5_RHIAP